MAANTMDAIKKKMQAMRAEKENAFDRADQLELRLIEQKLIYEKQDEEIQTLNKRITSLGGDVQQARSQLLATTDKLDDANRQLADTEAEVQTLMKRVRALEDDYEQTESRLQTANEKLELATKAVDESERGRKVLESRSATDEERIFLLQQELEEFVLLGEETDRKFEETAHQLAMTEVDLERGDARLEAAENKIHDLEEELRIVCNNMKSLEIYEQESVQRGVVYEKQIKKLTASLQHAENRLNTSERLMAKLQEEVDRLEDELATERAKCKTIITDLDTTFTELAGF